MKTEGRKTNKLLATISCGIMIFLNFGMAGMYSPLIPTFMNDLGVNATRVSMGPLLAGLASAVFSAVGIRVMKKIGPKSMLLIAGVVSVISGLVHFRVANIGMLYFGSVLNGIVIAFGTNAVVSSAVEMIHGKGFHDVLGVILGAGIFGTTGATAFVALMQSTLGWRAAYLIFVTGGGILCLVLNLLFIPGKKAPAAEEAASEAESSPEDSEAVSGLTKEEAVKTKSYRLLILAVILTSVLFGSVTSFAASFWQGHGVEPATSTMWLTMITFVGGILTMTSGVILSKLGTKAYLFISYIGYAVGVVCLILWGNHPVVWLAIIAIVLIASVRMVNGLVQMIVPEMFGRKDYANINIGFMPFQYVGGMLGVPLAGVIYDAAGSLVPVFLMVAAFAIIALVLVLTGLKVTPYRK